MKLLSKTKFDPPIKDKNFTLETTVEFTKSGNYKRAYTKKIPNNPITMRRKSITPKQLQMLYELRARGWAIRRIAKRLGRAPSTIWYHLQKPNNT